MLKFIAMTLSTAACLRLYLGWSRRQAEAQIDEMQRAAFNTPGAAPPIPATVVVAGAGLVGGYLLLARLLGQPGRQAALSLLLAGIVGGLSFWRTAPREAP